MAQEANTEDFPNGVCPGRGVCVGTLASRRTPLFFWARGVLAAKVRHFGSNLLKCSREQIGTKPAKVGHLAPGVI